jgi:hypothetical protein
MCSQPTILDPRLHSTETEQFEAAMRSKIVGPVVATAPDSHQH